MPDIKIWILGLVADQLKADLRSIIQDKIQLLVEVKKNPRFLLCIKYACMVEAPQVEICQFAIQFLGAIKWILS